MVSLPNDYQFTWLKPFVQHQPSYPYLQMKFAGWERKPTFYRWAHSLGKDSYLVHYVLEGQGSLTTQKAAYSLSAGDAFLITHDTPGIVSPHPDVSWDTVFFALHGKWVSKLLESSVFGPSLKPVAHMQGERLFDTIYELIQAVEQGAPRRDWLCLQAAIDLLMQCQLAHTDAPPGTTAAQRCWSRAQEYLEKQHSLSFTVQEMARDLFIDPSFLYRVCKSETGLSPHAYLVNYRLNKAEQYMCMDSLSLAELAAMAGFDSYTAFYRAFVRRHGVSPQQWRKK